jgi:L-threonylcarbamoyladenylate synthase
MQKPIIRKINPQNPEREIISEAARIIKLGGVITIPTRCLYGLAADAFNPAAVNEVFKIKRRPLDNPLLVLIEKKEQLDLLVKDVPVAALQIMDKFWPGRVTIVFEALASIPDDLTAKSGKIGVRIPGHAVAMELVKAVEGPVTGTSANLSGNAGCYRIDQLEPAVAQRADLILDAGNLAGGRGSTVVDVAEEAPQVLREGEVSTADIMEDFK